VYMIFNAANPVKMAFTIAENTPHIFVQFRPFLFGEGTLTVFSAEYDLVKYLSKCAHFFCRLCANLFKFILNPFRV
jgi:hypothetical protein